MNLDVWPFGCFCLNESAIGIGLINGLQVSATNCIFVIIPHNQFISGWAKLFSAKAVIIPHNQFVSGRAKLFSAEAGPMADLSTRSLMAVLSRQKQPDGQTSRFQRQIAFSLFSRTISLSAAGPSYSQQKQAQWPFYQREAQWPFYPSRSNRMARPPDFSDKLHFRQSRPNGRFINARPNCSFIKSSDRIAAAGPSHFQQKQAQWPFYEGRRRCKLAKSGPIAVLP